MAWKYVNFTEMYENILFLIQNKHIAVTEKTTFGETEMCFLKQEKRGVIDQTLFPRGYIRENNEHWDWRSLISSLIEIDSFQKADLLPK